MQNNSAPVSPLEQEHGEPASILVYGRDAQLLETRRWILERAGMKVTITTDLGEVAGILVNEAIDLFILCHTLSPEEGDICLMNAHALRPAMKKLILTANTPLGSLGSHEVKVSAFDGPKTLISEVERLLGARSTGTSPA
jgi:DNA-binding NtrC family response regulator